MKKEGWVEGRSTDLESFKRGADNRRNSKDLCDLNCPKEDPNANNNMKRIHIAIKNEKAKTKPTPYKIEIPCTPLVLQAEAIQAAAMSSKKVVHIYN